MKPNDVVGELGERISDLTELIERVEFEDSVYSSRITDEESLVDAEARMGKYASGQAQVIHQLEAIDEFLWNIRLLRRRGPLDIEVKSMSHFELREVYEEAKQLSENLLSTQKAIRSLKRLYADGNPRGFLSRRLSRVLKDLPLVDDLEDEMRSAVEQIDRIEDLQKELDRRYLETEAATKLHAKRIEQANRVQSLVDEVKKLTESAKDQFADWGRQALNPWIKVRDQLRLLHGQIAPCDQNPFKVSDDFYELWKTIDDAQRTANAKSEIWHEGVAILEETRTFVTEAYRVLASYEAKKERTIIGFPEQLVLKFISGEDGDDRLTFVIEVLQTPDEVRLLEIFGLNAVGAPIARARVVLESAVLIGQWIQFELPSPGTEVHSLRVQGLRISG